MAKQVEFLKDFDHNIPPFGRVTVTYKAGEVRLVSEACYAAAVKKDAVKLLDEDDTPDEEVNEADGIG